MSFMYVLEKKFRITFIQVYCRAEKKRVLISVMTCSWILIYHDFVCDSNFSLTRFVKSCSFGKIYDLILQLLSIVSLGMAKIWKEAIIVAETDAVGSKWREIFQNQFNTLRVYQKRFYLLWIAYLSNLVTSKISVKKSPITAIPALFSWNNKHFVNTS